MGVPPPVSGTDGGPATPGVSVGGLRRRRRCFFLLDCGVPSWLTVTSTWGSAKFDRIGVVSGWDSGAGELLVVIGDGLLETASTLDLMLCGSLSVTLGPTR